MSELKAYCYCEPCEWQPCECEPCGVCIGEECPACGEPIDYCQGHGEIGDPAGYALLQRLEDER